MRCSILSLEKQITYNTWIAIKFSNRLGLKINFKCSLNYYCSDIDISHIAIHVHSNSSYTYVLFTVYKTFTYVPHTLLQLHALKTCSGRLHKLESPISKCKQARQNLLQKWKATSAYIWKYVRSYYLMFYKSHIMPWSLNIQAVISA